MKTLHIISSPRWARSKSRELWEFLTSKLWWEVITLDLNEVEVPYLTNDVITFNYWYMKYEDLSDKNKKVADLQRKYIDVLKSVDNVVVSAPLWNFGMPAVLKWYVDLVTKVWDTFLMNENGYEWLVKNVKNLYIVETKGWVYAWTAWQDIETLEKNIKQTFGFLWITNAKTFSIEWANRKDEATLNGDIEKLKEEIVKSV